MTISYKLQKDAKGRDLEVVQKTEDGISCYIPFDEANKDYQEYLKWLNGEDPYTEKGTPEAAD